MRPEVEKLLVLQDRDQKIARLRNDIDRIPREEDMAHARMKGDQSALTTAQERLQLNEIATKNLELDTETRRTTIARLKTQQFETRKNEEYRALGHEVERYELDIAKLEDQQLELMEQAESLKANVAAAKQRFQSTKSQVEDELAVLTQRKDACNRQIAELEADRDALTDGIEEALLGQYGRIFRNKKDAAVVPLDHGVCSGCHMKVTSATLHSVRADSTVTFCENCGRILYRGDD